MLTYMYHHGVYSKRAAFEHDAHGAAIAVGRFAHIYDAPHALQLVQGCLTAFHECAFRKQRPR